MVDPGRRGRLRWLSTQDARGRWRRRMSQGHVLLLLLLLLTLLRRVPSLVAQLLLASPLCAPIRKPYLILIGRLVKISRLHIDDRGGGGGGEEVESST